MISESLEDAMNEQMKNEFYSAYLYLSMAAYFDDQDLDGFFNWFREQAREEQFHAMKFYHFLNERGGRVELRTIEKPQKEFKSVEDVFETSLDHEKKVTSMINDLMDMAKEEGDHASINFLNWFVDEQVEEEDQFESVLAKVKRIGENGQGLLMLDKDLGQRQFNEAEEVASESEDQ